MERFPVARSAALVWQMAVLIGVFGTILVVPTWIVIPGMTWMLVLALVVLVFGGVTVSEHLHLARMRKMREGDSLCTFARSFRRREVDTWVVRAVYEGLTASQFGIPVRARDTFDAVMLLDPDDLDELAREIARRAGRRFPDPF